MIRRLMQDRDLTEPVIQHVSRDFAHVGPNCTVADALAEIRAHPPQSRIIYFYVLDDESRLVGVVPTRRLLLSSPEQPIAEIMVRNVIAIPSTATVLEACEFFTLHKLLAFPVLDEERRMQGTVDIDLYTEGFDEVEAAERSDDLFQLIGVHLAEAQQASSWTAFRYRFPWLLANIGGGILAAFLSGVFEAELQQVVALALFIPVVLALAESVSIQSVSLALDLLRAQKPTLKLLFTKLRREALTGLLLGSACAMLVATVAAVWLRDARVAACVLVGITGGVACAAVFGVAMPNVLRMFRRDPHVAAGPLSLAAADMLTLLIYFNFARWIFG